MDFDTFRPILSGLIGALVVYFLARSRHKPAKTVGTKKFLVYGIGFKIFSAILIPGSLFVAYAASQARSSQVILAACIAAAFLVSAIFFAYQAFFVSLAYDNDNIYYKTPIGGSYVIPWTDVLEVGYSSFMQSHYIRTIQVQRIWCSYMLCGYEEFGEFLAKKADEHYGPEC